MSDTEDAEALAFGAALVREIRVEMARNDIRSVRALADKTGGSHAALNDRLNRSSRTGKRVAIGQEDLWRIAEALNVEPGELVHRAAEAVRANRRTSPSSDTPGAEAG